MFYIKSKAPDGRAVKSEITDENVFTKCPECGRELAVDLGEVFSEGEGDLFSTNIICSRCTVRELADRAKAMGPITVPATYEAIVMLGHVLISAGNYAEVSNLLGLFDIDDFEELETSEYTAFGKALEELAIELMEGALL